MVILRLILATSILYSCAVVNKVAVKTTGGVIYEGMDEILTENNWENFKASTPANLKLVEGLWYTDQKNKKLLTLLIKGYSAYAFGMAETEALDNIVLDDLQNKKLDQTILYYEKAIFYGLKYLDLLGISQKEFYDKAFSTQLNDVYESKVSSDDYIAIFYFSQALGSSINIQRYNFQKMSYMNHALKSLSWICNKNPDIEQGMCQLFQAVLMASMPSIMGGSQSKAKEHFQKIINSREYDILSHVSFMQYHLIPMLEEEEFAKEQLKIQKKIDVWYETQKGNYSKNSVLYLKHRNYNLFNAIAKKRFEKILKLQKEIF